MPDPNPNPNPAPPNPAAPPNPPAPPAGDPKPGDPPAGAAPPGAPKPGDPKPADPPAKVVPDKYDLKLSENTLLVPRDTERIAAFAKEQKLSQEEAQALVEKTEADYQTYRDDLVTAWNAEVQNDKELGGANFTATNKHVKTAMDFLAPEGSPLRALLFNSGYGSNPEVVRAFAKLGKHLGEDAPPAGAKPGNGAPAPKEQPLENRMFPNQVPTPVG